MSAPLMPAPTMMTSNDVDDGLFLDTTEIL